MKKSAPKPDPYLKKIREHWDAIARMYVAFENPSLCANMNETLPPSEFRVEGGEGMRDEYPA